MSLFNDSLPPNTEAVKNGAQRIREMKTLLNTLLTQVFNDDTTFKSGFIAASSLFAPGTVNTAALADSAVTTPKLANGALSADTAGRAKMADNFIEQSKLALDFTLPAGNVGSLQLATDSVVTAAIAAGAVTVAKAAAGVAKIAIGSYSGSNSVSAVISGLDFAPDFVVITGGTGQHNVVAGFRSEGSGGPTTGNLHALWNTGAIGGAFVNSIQWNSDGFTIVPSNFTANNGGQNHTYIAFKV